MILQAKELGTRSGKLGKTMYLGIDDVLTYIIYPSCVYRISKLIKLDI